MQKHVLVFLCLCNVNMLYGVTCYNVIGSSISGDNQVSTANCNGYPGTTLVGCHFNATNPSANDGIQRGHDGTYFQGSTCYARSGPTGRYIYICVMWYIVSILCKVHIITVQHFCSCSLLWFNIMGYIE